jgi:hypothetical protein
LNILSRPCDLPLKWLRHRNYLPRVDWILQSIHIETNRRYWGSTSLPPVSGDQGNVAVLQKSATHSSLL